MKQVSSWGRLTHDQHQVKTLYNADDILTSVCDRNALGLAHGMGRSYGDVCLNPQGLLWMTTSLNHFIAFNESTGRLICEAGVLLQEIQRLFVPRGWMLPVTPGTQLVTVGGAIANDVHGKNHVLCGSFGHHVERIKLVRTTGEVIECGPHLRTEWFEATVGGLGLTGVIVEAQLRLRRVASPWLEVQTIPYGHLEDFFRLVDESGENWEHTVAWIDCLSQKHRGVFTRGNFSKTCEALSVPRNRQRRVPWTPPLSLVNSLSLRLFNHVYYRRKQHCPAQTRVHYEPFFYPLDNVLEWNRLYGPHGFFQYQSVVPWVTAKEAIARMLKTIAYYKMGSFLAVLKVFGDRQSLGLLSFPQPGVTLALDFPNHGKKVQTLFEQLDTIVLEAGGRLYPAKDACMSRRIFEAGYPKISEFLKYRDWGISSALSRRLIGN